MEYIKRLRDLREDHDKTQQQIAKLLNVSSPTVSRLLAGAVQKEIVRIDIQNIQMVKFWELEQKLKKSCGLQDVIIVDSSENPEETKKLLGATASQYLESIVSPGDKVGISMGSTLYHMAYNPAGKSIENVTFVPLLGGMGRLRPRSTTEAFWSAAPASVFPLPPIRSRVLMPPVSTIFIRHREPSCPTMPTSSPWAHRSSVQNWQSAWSPST